MDTFCLPPLKQISSLFKLMAGQTVSRHIITACSGPLACLVSLSLSLSLSLSFLNLCVGILKETAYSVPTATVNKNGQKLQQEMIQNPCKRH